MRYLKNQIKDEEIPTLLFIIESLLDTVFGMEYEYVKTIDIQYFISRTDSVNNTIKPISITVVKSMLALVKFDTKYRPKYTSIEYLIYGLQKQKRSFLKFQKENITDINLFFRELNYNILKINPVKKTLVNQKKVKHLLLNNQIQTVDTTLGVIENLLHISEKITEKLEKLTTKEVNLKPYSSKSKFRIAKRIELKDLRRQKNIEKIINKAIRIAHDKEKTKEHIEIDWAVDFFDVAKDCSDEYMQYLWAKLLAGEAEKPGKYSRRTIHLIKMMTKHEARVFSVICSCIWHLKDPYAGGELILILEDHYYRGHFFDDVYNFKPDDLENLENIGLLKLSYTELLNDETFEISFFGRKHNIAHPTLYEFGYAGLSRSGEEMFSLVNPEPLMDFYEKTLNFLKKNKVLIK